MDASSETILVPTLRIKCIVQLNENTTKIAIKSFVQFFTIRLSELI